MNVVSFLQPLDRADTPDWVISSHQEILTLVSWNAMSSYLSTYRVIYIWTAMANGSEWVVSEVGAGGDVEGVELGAVGGQAVQRLVGQLAAGGQVQGFNVTTVGGEAAEGRVTNILQWRVMKDKANTAWFNSTKFSFLWSAPDNPWGWGSLGIHHISLPGSQPQFPQCQLGTQTSQPSASWSRQEPTHSMVCSPKELKNYIETPKNSFLSTPEHFCRGWWCQGRRRPWGAAPGAASCWWEPHRARRRPGWSSTGWPPFELGDHSHS